MPSALFTVLNQVFLTDADDQNGKNQINSCLHWYAAKAKQWGNLRAI